MASTISEGVAHPGECGTFNLTASLMTFLSMLGETKNLAPALTQSLAYLAVSTVPAPTITPSILEYFFMRLRYPAVPEVNSRTLKPPLTAAAMASSAIY